MIRPITILTTLAVLAACSSPNPPTKSASDVARSFNKAEDLSTAPFTLTEDLPTGSVTYTGEIGADVSGDLNGSINGDMTMNVGFDTGLIDGSVRNINLVGPDGRPDQRLGGRLEIDGFENSGRLEALAFGDLTAVNSSGNELESDVLLTLEGDVVNDRDAGDAVFGAARGNGVGDLEFEADGVFFGTLD